MARARGQETVRDMVLSLAVVMAGVLLFFLFVMPRGNGQQVKVVSDATTSVQSFARQAPYPVLAPTGLGQNLWKPTSLRMQVPGSVAGQAHQAMLTIGYVIDRKNDQTFARYEVTNDPNAVQQVLGNRPVTGTTTLGGQPWELRPDNDGHLALTRVVGAATIIVDDGAGAGGADRADLEALAASLRPVQAATS
ncbi:DUF4245 domain-containing protein [Pseudofrankia inefficax]|uniref:DUF4245 domain-containing protein n=1 Tax=Pseudofrankia inefficax (strain DSM 45817 / CECT 9037 / DDB 130130 / EuI1c) TaxID=298654 RepID=E3ITL6_PSEI1|nr:DUF4245 domain-containing protein [Pseudofrankia inefficax]ADP78773.1 hypothetical protein FraEuI1c_0695 [Pseudofrankia inefficax]